MSRGQTVERPMRTHGRHRPCFWRRRATAPQIEQAARRDARDGTGRPAPSDHLTTFSVAGAS